MTEIALSPVELNLETGLRREMPRAPHLRPPDYEEQFDAETVFYDCFASTDDDCVVLLGPPLANLQETVLAALQDLFEAGDQVRVVKMVDNATSQVWLKSTKRSVDLPDPRFRQTQVAIQPNGSALFAGRRVLLTLSKDNDLPWIRDWVTFFVRRHGCDAVLFYDNASTRYDTPEIQDVISSVPGIVASAVVHWPYKYGPQGTDAFHDTLKNASAPSPLPWDSAFCQPGMLEHARHRFLSLAEGVVNADVDELVLTEDGESVFEILERSRHGYLKYPGYWIEDVTETRAEEYRHCDFCYQAKDRPGEYPGGYLWKWAVVPERCPPEAIWLPHGVQHMKRDAELSQLISYRHFRAINTGWKYQRRPVSKPSEHEHVKDEELEAAMQVLKVPDRVWRLSAPIRRLKEFSAKLRRHSRSTPK